MCNSCPSVAKLSLNKAKVLLALENDEDYKKGEIHQSLLNVVYWEWQKPQNDGLTYEELIQFAIKEYGELIAFAVLIGKYNHQVCNGGHYQYYDNGYASGVGGFGTRHDEETGLHNLLLSYLLRNEELKEKEWYPELKDILEKFLNFKIDKNQYETETCSECYGDGYIEEDSDDEDGEPNQVRCSNCGGSGQEDVDNEGYYQPYGHDWENLDTRYYNIEEKVTKDLNEYFKHKLS